MGDDGGIEDDSLDDGLLLDELVLDGLGGGEVDQRLGDDGLLDNDGLFGGDSLDDNGCSNGCYELKRMVRKWDRWMD